MVSAGEREVSKAEREVEGDCLLRMRDRSLRRNRCGIMTGREGSQDSGT